MKTKLFYSFFFFTCLMAFSAVAQTVDIARWTYEPLQGTNTNPTPNIGSGTSEVVGAMTGAGTATGMNPDGSGCGSQTSGTTAWAIGTASPGTSNESSGVQWNISTVGYKDLSFTWDQRWSNASTNTIRLQYTTDGTNWVNFEMTEDNTTYCMGSLHTGRFQADVTGDSYRRISVDLSAISTANDNEHFGIRIVAAYYQDTEEFRRVTNPGTVATGGTWRFDNVALRGEISATSFLLASENALSGFNYAFGEGPSAVQSYTITGEGLTGTGDILVETTGGFEVSVNAETGFANTLNLPYAEGVITGQPITVYVRLVEGLNTACSYAGEITHSGGDAAEVKINLSGFVNATLYPELHNLTDASFEFNTWSALSPCRTYPASMRFWATDTNEQSDRFAEPLGLYQGVYNATSASRFIGQEENGVSFVVTGTEGQGFPLGVVAGINAHGRKNIAVNWTGFLVSQADGTVPREFALRLQYKTGVSGEWLDVPGPVEFYTAGKSAEDAESFGPVVLPSETFDQAELYLRWVYYAILNEGRGGSRPQIRLSDVVVSSIALDDVGTSVEDITVSGVYASNGRIHFVAEEAGRAVQVYNALGQQLGVYLTSQGANAIAVQASGVVLVKVDGKVFKLIL